jgi:type IV pilus assembly protein PilA
MLVVLIVAVALAVPVITVVLILATLTIPAMQSVARRANEVSAIASLRLLNQMQAMYLSNYPDQGFACSLASLGRSAASPASPAAAHLLPDDLAGGFKSGYVFVISSCTKATTKNQTQFTSYTITAVPSSLGHSGNRGFCTDESAQIRYDPKGGTNCTELLQ